MKWVNVTDSLPKSYEDVLMASNSGSILIGYVTSSGCWMESNDYCRVMKPSYWMPLPEHPNKSGEN